ncbi:RagB/SusD family nutrient uptake outer membrane protein [Parapedobacter sp. GCM10030251]|uniref:RagB/SusD family nutrient uptake outer membrane protein n=1 Tax=Parapedobacter sp. GCM10030251 TaxID=3273419 RepID=UPI0036239C7D
MKFKFFNNRTKWFGCVAVFAISAGGCGNFLEIAPKEAVAAESAIIDETSLNTAIRGAYRALGASSYYGEGFVNLGFVPTGDVIYNVADNLSDLNFRSTDAAFGGPWAAIYHTINITNHIIEKAPAITDVNLTDAEREVIIGEAHFIRALAYFDLARGWGGVPIKLTPTNRPDDGNDIPRSTREQVYERVESELQRAEELLPAAVNRIRATKYTAWALRARLALYRGQWEQAVAYSSKVIALTDAFQLVEPFAAWFLGGVTQTPESIFEIAFSAQNPNGLRTRMSLLARGGEYRYRPGDAVVNTLRNPKTGGDRIALLDSVRQGGLTQYAGALYYRSPATDPSYVLRIAEQYLIRAEAYAQLEQLEEAAMDLNRVRSRAKLDPIVATTQPALLDAILEERRLEFLWEAHRYFDLARTGRLKEQVEALKPNLRIEPHLALFPIPVDEVILGGLEQNPNY